MGWDAGRMGVSSLSETAEREVQDSGRGLTSEREG